MDRQQKFHNGGEWVDRASTSMMPVAVIVPFEDEADAIGIANDMPYGPSARLQTGNGRAGRIMGLEDRRRTKTLQDPTRAGRQCG